jgi:CMP-N-acetylneuraminic acid synthetase/spore coat polysaccharide biosynthesis predicted glycosyltransferase SpsG
LSKNSKYKILILIPARGGSKGIPQKNLRSLNKKPLIFYSIKNALTSSFKPDVYVSSDNLEILSIAKEFGAKTYIRNKKISSDSVTLDPVIFDAYRNIELIEKKKYDYVITLQPTSPLLKVQSLDAAIKKIINNKKIDTLISATDSTHLTWIRTNKKYSPNYIKRVNRQKLPKVFRETGAFLITKSQFITNNSRIGRNIDLYISKNFEETIDIDNYKDFKLCEFFLKRKKILFVVSGYKQIGLGHVYNTLLLANEIIDHDIIFLVDKKSELAFKKIKSKNYKVFKQQKQNIIFDIKKINPDIIINDILDTKQRYMKNLNELNKKIINFEDLGEGSKLSDLTINAIYSKKRSYPKTYFGHKYFVLRDEFVLKSPRPINKKVKNILITFGGVDPNNFTKKVITAIQPECKKRKINVKVITGFGYKQHGTLKFFKNIEVLNNVQNISDHMYNADLIFSSAGRTTYEIASLGVPAIILAQNNRELEHIFCSYKNGFINLGLGTLVNNQTISECFIKVIENYDKRKLMSKLMLKNDLKLGKQRVINLIDKVINA